MEYTESQIQEIKAKFAHRKRLQWIVGGILFAIVIVFLIVVKLGDPAWGRTLMPVFFGAIVGSIVFSFRNWRCPACDKYLGRSMGMNFCPKCGVQLS